MIGRLSCRSDVPAVYVPGQTVSVAFAITPSRKVHERKGGKMQAVERIDEQGGYVAIDFRGCSSQELSEMY